MDLHEFNKNAIKTESLVDTVITDRAILMESLVAFEQVSELLDALKKSAFYNKPIDVEKLMGSADSINKIGYVLSNEDIWEIGATKNDDINPRLFHAIIGILTEAGELATILINHLQGEELDTVNMLEEFGDIAWYQAIAYDELNVDPYHPLVAVINKLRARYPNKFTSDDAINRDVDSERAILEDSLKGE
jgi:hypothetical protein